MRLNDASLSRKSWWTDRGYRLPGYDRAAMRRATVQRPLWVHFGGGNIFRAFIARAQEQLLNEGHTDRGIILAGSEIVEKIYRPMDSLTLAVTLKADGAIEKEVRGSIAESLTADPASPDWVRLLEIFRSESLQMASFTITEKGYRLTDSAGAFLPDVASDFERGPAAPGSFMGQIAALAYSRFRAGEYPLAFVSMDNCSHNGDRVFEALTAFAQEWEKRGLADAGFVRYLGDKTKVSFPWSMIDKITPRPDDKVVALLKADGFEDTQNLVTAKGSFVAPFVNAEETGYLVIEDWFPAGRPPLEKAGVLLTERSVVDKVEKMKVCACLNPLHTALAVFGCLLGYRLISQEMKDPELLALVRRLGYGEALPVVEHPGILDPKEFLDTVLELRFPNVYMPDSPQRIATDTSQKLPIRFGETIKAYLASETLDVNALKLIPLVLAGWLRYLMAADDEGEPLTLSDDPLLPELTPIFSGIQLGAGEEVRALLKPVISNASIFGVDLYDASLGRLVEDYFLELAAGKGAVRDTLRKYVHA